MFHLTARECLMCLGDNHLIYEGCCLSCHLEYIKKNRCIHQSKMSIWNFIDLLKVNEEMLSKLTLENNNCLYNKCLYDIVSIIEKIQIFMLKNRKCNKLVESICSVCNTINKRNLLKLNQSHTLTCSLCSYTFCSNCGKQDHHHELFNVSCQKFKMIRNKWNSKNDLRDALDAICDKKQKDEEYLNEKEALEIMNKDTHGARCCPYFSLETAIEYEKQLNLNTIPDHIKTNEEFLKSGLACPSNGVPMSHDRCYEVVCGKKAEDRVNASEYNVQSEWGCGRKLDFTKCPIYKKEIKKMPKMCLYASLIDKIDVKLGYSICEICHKKHKLISSKCLHQDCSLKYKSVCNGCLVKSLNGVKKPKEYFEFILQNKTVRLMRIRDINDKPAFEGKYCNCGDPECSNIVAVSFYNQSNSYEMVDRRGTFYGRFRGLVNLIPNFTFDNYFYVSRRRFFKISITFKCLSEDENEYYDNLSRLRDCYHLNHIRHFSSDDILKFNEQYPFHKSAIIIQSNIRRFLINRINFTKTKMIIIILQSYVRKFLHRNKIKEIIFKSAHMIQGMFRIRKAKQIAATKPKKCGYRGCIGNGQARVPCYTCRNPNVNCHGRFCVDGFKIINCKGCGTKFPDRICKYCRKKFTPLQYYHTRCKNCK